MLVFCGELVLIGPESLMDGTEQAVQTGIFGIALWLKCALAGSAVGAAVAAAQVFPGRWHPAWAQRLVYWFSCPLFAGLAIGVVVALRGVPPLSGARTLWLILCLVIGGFTSLLAAAAIAFLSKNYDPEVASKSKRVSKRAARKVTSRTEEWEDRLRSLFRPPPTAKPVETELSATAKQSNSSTVARPIPGQRAKLPPERYPLSEAKVKVPNYAGKPSRNPNPSPDSQGKLVKPIK